MFAFIEITSGIITRYEQAEFIARLPVDTGPVPCAATIRQQNVA